MNINKQITAEMKTCLPKFLLPASTAWSHRVRTKSRLPVLPRAPHSVLITTSNMRTTCMHVCNGVGTFGMTDIKFDITRRMVFRWIQWKWQWRSQLLSRLATPAAARVAARIPMHSAMYLLRAVLIIGKLFFVKPAKLKIVFALPDYPTVWCRCKFFQAKLSKHLPSGRILSWSVALNRRDVSSLKTVALTESSHHVHPGEEEALVYSLQ